MLKKILYLFTVLFFTTISYAQNLADTSIVDEKLETEIIEEIITTKKPQHQKKKNNI